MSSGSIRWSMRSVMESRGIYMSTEPAAVKKYGDGLLGFNERILGVVKNWETLVQADDAEQFAAFKKRIEQFIDFRKELVRRGIEIGAAAGREWGDNDANRDVRTALNKDLEALSKVYAERSKNLAQRTDANRTMALVLTGLGAAALIVVVLGVLIIARSVARPLSQITADHQARRRRRPTSVEVPHTRSRRRDRRAGARHQACSRRRWTATAASMRRSCRIPRRATRAAGTSRASVEAFRGTTSAAVLRAVHDNAATDARTAQTIATVAADANGRAVTAAERDRTGLEQRLRGRRRCRKSFRPRSRRSAARSRNPPARSIRPARAPTGRSARSRALPPPPSASTAC